MQNSHLHQNTIPYKCLTILPLQWSLPVLRYIFETPMPLPIIGIAGDIEGCLNKTIEIIGSSDKGWEDAAQVAVDEAKKTMHGIQGS
jgi:Dodecin